MNLVGETTSKNSWLHATRYTGKLIMEKYNAKVIYYMEHAPYCFHASVIKEVNELQHKLLKNNLVSQCQFLG